MPKIIIAYNNSYNTDLHNYFQLCADNIRQSCAENKHHYTSITPPELTEDRIMENIQTHHFCFIAMHGDADGVYNENNEDVISTRTTNYAFKEKCLYSIACHCAKNLKEELTRIGINLFVGYENEYHVGYNDTIFADCAMEGAKQICSGSTFEKSKAYMLAKYDESINELYKSLNDTENNSKKNTLLWDATFLLENKENLIFEGELSLTLSDIK